MSCLGEIGTRVADKRKTEALAEIRSALPASDVANSSNHSNVPGTSDSSPSSDLVDPFSSSVAVSPCADKYFSRRFMLGTNIGVHRDCSGGHRVLVSFGQILVRPWNANTTATFTVEDKDPSVLW